jgi:CubicO group peptidase (beta-lactamase class C family)
MRRFALCLSLMLCLAPLPRAWAEAVPVFSNTGPDADAYGAAEGYPIGTPQSLGSQRTLVGAYSHYDQLRPGRAALAPAVPSRLDRAAEELKLNFTFQGEALTLDSYLERNPTTGLLILRGHTILFEHYRYARTEAERFTSQSMAKTVVAMLVGIAVGEGVIHSVDDDVSLYLPELAGTEIGRTPLRALLHMASGIRFREVYDGKDDISRLSRALMHRAGPSAAQIASEFQVRAAPPDTVFNYSGLDTELLGLALARAVKMPLTDYLAQKLWTPLGAEAAASWTTDANGQEVAYCCFNAVLRDWGRLGALLADDGAWGEKQIIPRQWLLDATTPQRPFLAPGFGGKRLGYGYQVWLLPGDRRQFSLRGIYGQTVMIDPKTKLVLVHTAARPKATNNVGEAELMVLWNALVAQQGG